MTDRLYGQPAILSPMLAVLILVGLTPWRLSWFSEQFIPCTVEFRSRAFVDGDPGYAYCPAHESR